MRMAQKKSGRLVQAFELGTDTLMERELVREGKIQVLSDGEYRLFSLESIGSKGQRAKRGDFFKVDETTTGKFPYPLARKFFFANHKAVDGNNTFEQITKPLKIWLFGDAISAELSFLLKTGKLILDEKDVEHYYNAFVWDTHLTGSSADVLVIYNETRTSDGELFSIDFGIVQRDIFDKTYVLLT